MKDFESLSQNDDGDEDDDNNDDTSENLCSSFVPGATVRAVHILTHIMLTTVLR